MFLCVRNKMPRTVLVRPVLHSFECKAAQRVFNVCESSPKMLDSDRSMVRSSMCVTVGSVLSPLCRHRMHHGEKQLCAAMSVGSDGKQKSLNNIHYKIGGVS